MKLIPTKKPLAPARPLCFGAWSCPTPGMVHDCDHRDSCIGASFSLRTKARSDAGEAFHRLLLHENNTLRQARHLLREIAVEIGPITGMDLETFSPEDRLEIQPTFALLCRIADYFGDEGRCAACGPHELEAVVQEVDPKDLLIKAMQKAAMKTLSNAHDGDYCKVCGEGGGAHASGCFVPMVVDIALMPLDPELHGRGYGVKA